MATTTRTRCEHNDVKWFGAEPDVGIMSGLWECQDCGAITYDTIEDFDEDYDPEFGWGGRVSHYPDWHESDESDEDDEDDDPDE